MKKTAWRLFAITVVIAGSALSAPPTDVKAQTSRAHQACALQRNSCKTNCEWNPFSAPNVAGSMSPTIGVLEMGDCKKSCDTKYNECLGAPPPRPLTRHEIEQQQRILDEQARQAQARLDAGLAADAQAISNERVLYRNSDAFFSGDQAQYQADLNAGDPAADRKFRAKFYELRSNYEGHDAVINTRIPLREYADLYMYQHDYTQAEQSYHIDDFAKPGAKVRIESVTEHGIAHVRFYVNNGFGGEHLDDTRSYDVPLLSLTLAGG